MIAFKDFHPIKGILGSPWIGFGNFEQFFNSIYFWRLMKNTILLSLYSLLWGFPVPILFALLLNELREGLFKKSVQTISYLPHFISIVVVVGMIVNFTSIQSGVINQMLAWFGVQPISFLSEPGWFRTIFVSSSIWQGFGWGSIIYLAAISGIDQQLYEAAEIDGASRWRKMWHITLPCLVPTIVILLILNAGSLMEVGYEKIILLYNPTTYETADVISTFVYRQGIEKADYSYSAAIGLFNNIINMILLLSVNRISKKMTETSLW
ncbi:putative aldouronate transport system permease protein [Paenibacillus eucommiae]|uniref:Aldouronate transport system permease protein n=1 Tax=Paenibacillus eucommiae TaxID=1355755 RepID=A0ABS4ITA7_9BACL|nr:ABC transporter permease subunit [Paenibacillus eucommiae]MBP1990748.1 putative aldouronate transport system permease protein [Paenibacillus eucommiae]